MLLKHLFLESLQFYFSCIMYMISKICSILRLVYILAFHLSIFSDMAHTLECGLWFLGLHYNNSCVLHCVLLPVVMEWVVAVASQHCV